MRGVWEVLIACEHRRVDGKTKDVQFIVSDHYHFISCDMISISRSISISISIYISYQYQIYQYQDRDQYQYHYDMVFSYNRTDDFDLLGTDLAYDDHTETVAEIRAQPTQWDGLILNHAIPLGTYAKSCFCFRRMTGQ